MPDNNKLIKVSYIRQEKEYISELFPEYELLEQKTLQMTVDGKSIPVDMLTVQTNQGKKTFYFDVSDIFAKYDAFIANNGSNLKDLTGADFAKLLMSTTLGVQTREEKERMPWIRKMQEGLKTIETEQEPDEEIDDSERESFMQILSSIKLLAILSFIIFLLALIFAMPD
ncbi:MAG: hypothetical protein ACI4NZ_03465 [Candidatus Enterousia sp.]